MKIKLKLIKQDREDISVELNSRSTHKIKKRIKGKQATLTLVVTYSFTFESDDNPPGNVLVWESQTLIRHSMSHQIWMFAMYVQ